MKGLKSSWGDQAWAWGALVALAFAAVTLLGTCPGCTSPKELARIAAVAAVDRAAEKLQPKEGQGSLPFEGLIGGAGSAVALVAYRELWYRRRRRNGTK